MRGQYGKLVRDHIPEMIARQGETPVWHTLSRQEYLAELCRKLKEETREFLEEQDPMELADLYEVADALAELLGGRERIAALQQQKRETNGAFRSRIYLEEVR